MPPRPRARQYPRPPMGGLRAEMIPTLPEIATADAESASESASKLFEWVCRADAVLSEQNGVTSFCSSPAVDTPSSSSSSSVCSSSLQGEGLLHRIVSHGDEAVIGSYARHLFTSVFGFAVPNVSALEIVKKYAEKNSSDGLVVEVGAGNGYWSYELGRCGVAVEASDSCEWEVGAALSPLLTFRHAWCEVQRKDAKQHILEKPTALPLIVWPYPDTAYIHEVVEFTQAKYIIVVGEEGAQGCTEDPFAAGHEAAVEWEEECRVEIPTWPFVYDVLKVMRRV